MKQNPRKNKLRKRRLIKYKSRKIKLKISSLYKELHKDLIQAFFKVSLEINNLPKEDFISFCSEFPKDSLENNSKYKWNIDPSYTNSSDYKI